MANENENLVLVATEKSLKCALVFFIWLLMLCILNRFQVIVGHSFERNCSMNAPKSRCIHIYTVGDYTKEDIIEKQDVSHFMEFLILF